MTNTKKKSDSSEEKTNQIETLRETIMTAEKTLQNAKAMLLQLEGKKKVGRKRKFESEEDENIVQGTFDGQIMLGTDGKQYPVPANYASKSKLVEGDMLKLTITNDGSFIYKQIGPVARKNIIGSVNQDEKGNYFVVAEGKPYKILLASITYFKVEPADEVVVVTSKDIESQWASIENVLRKGDMDSAHLNTLPIQENSAPKTKEKKEIKKDVARENEKEEEKDDQSDQDFYKQWASDIEEITKEIKEKN